MKQNPEQHDILGVTQLACKSCIYYRMSKTGTIIAAVHINDFLSIATSKEKTK